MTDRYSQATNKNGLRAFAEDKRPRCGETPPGRERGQPAYPVGMHRDLREPGCAVATILLADLGYPGLFLYTAATDRIEPSGAAVFYPECGSE